MHGPSSSPAKASRSAKPAAACETSSRAVDRGRIERVDVVAERTSPGSSRELEPLAVSGAGREPDEVDGCIRRHADPNRG